MRPTQGSNPGLLHCRRILYHLSHQGSLPAGMKGDVNEEVARGNPGTLRPLGGPRGCWGRGHHGAIRIEMQGSVQHHPGSHGPPHCLLEADLHVMHIYDAFPTTHRSPTAAEKLGFQRLRSSPSCLSLFFPGWGRSGKGPESHSTEFKSQMSPRSLGDSGQAATPFRASVSLPVKGK